MEATYVGSLPIKADIANNPIYHRKSIKMDGKFIGGFSHQIYLYGIRLELFMPGGANTVDFSKLSNVVVSGFLGFFYVVLVHVYCLVPSCSGG